MESIDNERLIDFYNNNSKSKLQSLFPFTSTAALNGVYYAIDDGAYNINLPCVVAFDKIILIDESYLFLDLEPDNIEEYRVKVIDAFYADGSVYILIQDLLTDKKRIISHLIERSKDIYSWFLIDIDYFNCLKSQKMEDNELLEFEF